MRPVIDALDGVDDERRGDAPAGREVDRDALQPLLEDLRTRLEEFDADALGLVERIGEQLQGTEHASIVGRLEKLVEEFDFEQAIAVADDLASSLKLELT